MRKLIVLLRLYLKFGLKEAIIAFYRVFYSSKVLLKFSSIKAPIYLRKDTTDFAVFEQIFLYNEYNLQVQFEPKVIVDAGANIGLFAVKMKNDFPSSKVISIEPDQENYEQLKLNMSQYEDVYFENCGLWSHETKLKVYDKYDQGKWGIVVEEDHENGTIPAISISSIIKKYGISRIDILKIDIESSEKALFSSNYQELFKHSKMIIIELHDLMLEGCSRTFFEALNQSIKKYTYMVSGENTIIINDDLD